MCLHTMDPKWQHAYISLKLGNFDPILYKIDHTKIKSQIHSSVPWNKWWSWVEKVNKKSLLQKSGEFAWDHINSVTTQYNVRQVRFHQKWRRLASNSRTVGRVDWQYGSAPSFAIDLHQGQKHNRHYSAARTKSNSTLACHATCEDECYYGQRGVVEHKWWRRHQKAPADRQEV